MLFEISVHAIQLFDLSMIVVDGKSVLDDY